MINISELAATIELIIWALMIFSIVAIVARKLKLPYTLGLIFIGLFISGLGLASLVGMEITHKLLTTIAPEVFLLIFLPGLLFEGAMNLETEYLLENIKSISLFAIVGVVLSVLGAGSFLYLILKIPLEISFLIAAMIVPTDPVAVLSILKRLGVSKKLGVLLEGESLFNDGTGIVVFKVILGLILTGSFSITQGFVEFFKVVLGGLAIGGVFGYLFSKIISKIEDDLIQITLTTILAYSSYLVAEHVHFSGVISVVTAGLIMGERGIKNVSAESKLEIKSFWTYVGFLLNSCVFLLIGLELKINDLFQYITPILVAFISVLAGRAISIYVISKIINKFDNSKIFTTVNENIPEKWQHMLVWGGLHGGLSMVLALGLPSSNITLLTWRPFILTTVFGAVFFSLFLQGTTIGLLVEKLGLSKKKRIGIDFDIEQARQYMYMKAEDEIIKMRSSNIISKKIYAEYHKMLLKEMKNSEKKITKMVMKHPELKEEQEKEIRIAVLSAYKSALTDGYRKGLFRKEAMKNLIEEINHDLVELTHEK